MLPCPSFGINDHARKHKPDSPFSHSTLDLLDVLDLVSANWDIKKPGFREGVFLVPLPCNPHGLEESQFFAPVVKVDAGTELVSTFGARDDNETPFMGHLAEGGKKARAVSCQAVIYAHDVLLENNGKPSTDADFELVTILANDTHEEQPADPFTMARNFLSMVGGTFADYTAQQFAQSIIYWATHVKVSPDFKDEDERIHQDALAEIAANNDYESRVYGE